MAQFPAIDLDISVGRRNNIVRRRRRSNHSESVDEVYNKELWIFFCSNEGKKNAKIKASTEIRSRLRAVNYKCWQYIIKPFVFRRYFLLALDTCMLIKCLPVPWSVCMTPSLWSSLALQTTWLLSDLFFFAYLPCQQFDCVAILNGIKVWLLFVCGFNQRCFGI